MLDGLMNAAGPTKHDKAIVVVKACIDEGITSGKAIVKRCVELGFTGRHVGITLKGHIGHYWQRDDNGHYSLIDD